MGTTQIVAEPSDSSLQAVIANWSVTSMKHKHVTSLLLKQGPHVLLFVVWTSCTNAPALMAFWSKMQFAGSQLSNVSYVRSLHKHAPRGLKHKALFCPLHDARLPPPCL